MDTGKRKLYTDLYTAVKNANPQSSGKTVQEKTNCLWSELKGVCKVDPTKHLDVIVTDELKKLRCSVTKSKASLVSFFNKHVPSSQKINVYETASSPTVAATTLQECTPAPGQPKPLFKSPVQESLRQEISLLESEIVLLSAKQETGLGTHEAGIELKKKRKVLDLKRKLLKRKRDNADCVKKLREKKRKEIINLRHTHPEIAAELTIRNRSGRPAIEDDQPGLLKTISDLAIIGGSADARRRSETIRACRTLDELTKELEFAGYSISRSATYLRLLPRSSRTQEGKRHVTTVPVRLKRPEAGLHKEHSDQYFCSASIHQLEELASFLGQENVSFISQDDKSRVPIGLTAAHKQAPMLMHLEYRVLLPDHDWVVAERHKLIPSVYAGIIIGENGMGNRQSVGYSGPTYIAIRSGKHQSSTAASHAYDFEQLLEVTHFQSILKTKQAFVKPVLIFTVDGGQDENPRYRNVILCAAKLFKMHNLDGLFIATNAPGRSAYNRVERRMAPLSRDLTGVILQHDHFGSHLNDRGETINVDLEKANFKYAGEVLAEIWRGTTINGYHVEAQYVDSDIEYPAIGDVDEVWKSIHLRESQYFLQIVRCQDRTCCTEWRSQYIDVIPERFLPNPVSVTCHGPKLMAVLRNQEDSVSPKFLPLFTNLVVGRKLQSTCTMMQQQHDKIAYDTFCPSVQTSLGKRVCSICGIYHASVKSLSNHKKIHRHVAPKVETVKKVRPVRVAALRNRELMAVLRDELNQETIEWLDQDEVEMESVVLPSSTLMKSHVPIISDLQDWITVEWEDVP